MPKDRYTVEQIAVVLVQEALSFEYYLQEEFNLYHATIQSPGDKPPEWSEYGEPLRDWCQKRVYELGMGAWEQEHFGDQLMLEDFHPLAGKVANADGPRAGKVAFLSLVIALVLEDFSRLVGGTGKELADQFHARVTDYLSKTWHMDLVQGTINPALGAVHLPLAQEAARRWRQRVELLSKDG